MLYVGIGMAFITENHCYMTHKLGSMTSILDYSLAQPFINFAQKCNLYKFLQSVQVGEKWFCKLCKSGKFDQILVQKYIYFVGFAHNISRDSSKIHKLFHKYNFYR